MSILSTVERPKSILDSLRTIALSSPDEKIRLDAFSKGLGRRSYGLLLLVLDLPNLIPLPLPLLSIIFGIPLALVGLQLALGIERPWTPQFLRERGIGEKEIIHFCDKFDEHYGWFHRLVHPRWFVFTRGFFVRLIGLAIFLLASIMALPIPFGNLVLAIPVGLLAIGLIERDGIFVCVGFLLGFCGLLLNLFVGSSIIWGAMVAIEHAITNLFV